MTVDLSRFDFHLRPDLVGVADRCVAVAFVTPCGEPADTRITRLAIDVAAIDLALVRMGCCPALVGHRDALEALVGKVEEVWIDGATLFALIRLGTSPEAERILGLLRDALPVGISVGARLIDSKPDPEGLPDSVLVTRWALNEISFVPLGADRHARVIRTGAEAVEMAERHRQRSLDERKKVALSALQASQWRHWSYKVGDHLAGIEPDKLSDFLVEQVGQQLDRLAGAMAHEVPPPPFQFAA